MSGDTPAIGGSGLGVDRVRKNRSVLQRWTPGCVGAVPGDPNAAVVLDLFSGCGGMSLGFAAVGKQTGAFTIARGVDINTVSAATYAANFGGTGVCNDVRSLANNPKPLVDLLPNRSALQAPPVVMIGCAPCQGFSAHSKKRWSRQEDHRNTLIGTFAEVVCHVKPDVAIMENVPELLSHRHWHHFEAFRDRLAGNGYTVWQAIENAARVGVPQERFRAVVVATRGVPFSFSCDLLERESFATVRDAIGKLPPVRAGQVWHSDDMHRSARHRKSTIEVIQAVSHDGGSRPAGIGPACLDKTKGFSDVYGRLSWDKPAITITHYARNPASGRFVHPTQDRGLTCREAARLQSFPDVFKVTGSFDDRFRQIGESVPPLLAVHLANVLEGALFGHAVLNEPVNVINEPVSNSYASVIAGMKAANR